MSRYRPSLMRSCPICGWRDITAMTAYEGHALPCCSVCASNEEPTGPEIEKSMASRSVQFAIDNPGLTARQIRIALEISEDERDSLSSALSRAVKDGELVRVGGGRGNSSGRYYQAQARKEAA